MDLLWGPWWFSSWALSSLLVSQGLSAVQPWTLELWSCCSWTGPPKEAQARLQSDKQMMKCEKNLSVVLSPAGKNDEVDSPGDTVDESSSVSMAGIHWACAVTCSSCSTHLPWHTVDPLVPPQGPCGSLCRGTQLLHPQTNRGLPHLFPSRFPHDLLFLYIHTLLTLMYIYTVDFKGIWHLFCLFVICLPPEFQTRR